MFTAGEIAAGTNRLTNGKLTVMDQKSLLSAFRLYLKNLAGNFSDLKNRLAEIANVGDDRDASKLAALLNSLEESGFSLSEMRGGRSGLQTNKKDELNLRLKYGLTILDYDVPEEFIDGFGGNDDSFSGAPLDVVIW